MNKTKLKNYAPKARQTFLRIVRERADLLGLTKKEIDTPRVEGDVAIIEGNPYPKRFANLHQNLKKAIEAEGLEAFIERVAYSWFNRFAAIRFMEVNGFLSHSYRVLSNRDISKNEPEILEHAADVELAGLDKAEIVEFKLAGNKDAELYKLLLIAQCNELHSAMPFLFERVNDETELLLPDNLLHTDSVIRKMTSEIEEEDWHNVEIIGWLYQFYISEKKDEVIGKTVKSADIPAATQLFTPNWIVKYMTQNSLGRLWLEVNPTSQLAQNMEFYISQGTSEQGRGTSEETETLVPRPSSLVPEEIRILDPACGSGHILVEAYDLMKAIYTERGYSSREIPLLILENNLFGLDIDKRAVQLASFALLMKARFDDRRIFEKFKLQTSNFKIPQIYEIPELPADNPEYEPKGIAEMFFSDGANRGAVPIRDEKYMFSEMNPQPSLVQSPESNVQSLKNNEQRTTNNEQITEQNIIDLLELFENGKTYGSLIRIPHGFGAVVARIARRVQTKAVSGDMNEQIAARQLIPFVQAAQILALKYDAVIANPPYMGGKGMNAALKDFAKREFPESKSDLFAMFIERNLELTKETGKLGFMTPFVWMFISSYEKLRDILINDATITTLVQLEYSGFAEATVPICTFTLAKKHDKNAVSSFIRLSDFKGHQNQAPKTLEAIQNTDCSWFYSAKPDNFKKIQGSPIAYWASDKMQNIYESHSSIGDFYSPKQGLSTADNNRFLRLWFEIAQVKSGFSISNLDEALQSKKKWFPLDKGGDYRKWYGNNEYVINWENNGYELRSLQPKSVIRSPNSYFKSGVTWGKITSGAFSTRATAEGFIFSDAGMKIPCEQTTDVHLLSGFLNSKLASHFLSALSETLNFEQGSISLLPLKKTNNFQVSLVEKMIEIARADWDSFETSWDFERFPILDFGFWIERNGKAPNSVEEAFRLWEELTEDRIGRMQELETENNRLFITAYGLEDELEPEVPLEQITLARADRTADTKKLLSYFIGCAMGRYSLDTPGLVYADAGGVGFDHSNYQTFTADEDGIIPVTDMEWFPQEAAGRFADFIKKAFATEDTEKTESFKNEEEESIDLKTSKNSVSSVAENLEWIAEGLGKKANETPVEAIRRYFSKDFFKDHIKTYKKRPIYWQFSSGKEKAFECLVYLHRYNEQTLARMRQEYVLPLMSKLEAQIENLAGSANEYGERSGGLIDSAESTSDKSKLSKQLETYRKKQAELKQFDEQLRHFSDMKIAIDLDDGVKENYAKFGDLVAMSKQISPKK